MSKTSTNRQYRIGDFARYMGVSPDFLKHYEAHGLIDAHYQDNGYRYYPFSQSSRILEYMRLRNYGATVKELNGMLSADDEMAIQLLNNKIEELQKVIERNQAVIEEHKRIKAWFGRRLIKPLDWEVRYIEPYYYLPHSHNRDFIRDERIYEILKNWVTWMPIVKSTLHIEPAPSTGDPLPVNWGLMVPQAAAHKYGIEINDSVIRLEKCKALIYSYYGDETLYNMDIVANQEHPVFDCLKHLGFKPAGSFYQLVEMRLTSKDGSRRSGCGRFIIPITER